MIYFYSTFNFNNTFTENKNLELQKEGGELGKIFRRKKKFFIVLGIKQLINNKQSKKKTKNNLSHQQSLHFLNFLLQKKTKKTLFLRDTFPLLFLYKCSQVTKTVLVFAQKKNKNNKHKKQTCVKVIIRNYLCKYFFFLSVNTFIKRCSI